MGTLKAGMLKYIMLVKTPWVHAGNQSSWRWNGRYIRSTEEAFAQADMYRPSMTIASQPWEPT